MEGEKESIVSIKQDAEGHANIYYKKGTNYLPISIQWN